MYTEQQYVRDTIRDYFKKQKITGKAVAKALGVSPSLVSIYMRGEKFLPQKFAKKLSAEYGFDEYFLTEGHQEVQINPKTGENMIVEHFLFPQDKDLKKQLQGKMLSLQITNASKTLSELLEKYKKAENILYEANRTISSVGNSIQQLEKYIKQHLPE